MEQKVKISLDSKELDQAIEKANWLIDSLR